MNELLNLAVKAHGGLERWNKVKSVKVAASMKNRRILLMEMLKRSPR